MAISLVIMRLQRGISRLTKEIVIKGFDLNRLKKLKPICVTEAITFLHTCEIKERKKNVGSNV